jgi:hypothetical protein
MSASTPNCSRRPSLLHNADYAGQQFDRKHWEQLPFQILLLLYELRPTFRSLAKAPSGRTEFMSFSRPVVMEKKTFRERYSCPIQWADLLEKNGNGGIHHGPFGLENPSVGLKAQLSLSIGFRAKANSSTTRPRSKCS